MSAGHVASSRARRREPAEQIATGKKDTRWPGARDSERYLIYLIAVALFGWALASFDFNIYTLTITDISKALHLSSTQVGLVGFFIYAGEFVGSFVFGMMMDSRGRRAAWLTALAGATIFTGSTFFVQNLWQLSLARALADFFAYAELAISVTIVNEELPAKHRGFLYSIVQAGWPLGVVWASLAYLGGSSWNFAGEPFWRWLFLLSVPPLFVCVVGRIWVKEPRRWLHIHEIRQAKKEGDDEKVKRLKKEYDIKADIVDKPSIAQLFTDSGVNRKQLVFLSLTWFFYGCMYTATNAYIIYWMNHYHHYSVASVAWLLLGSATVGFFLYMVAGAMGQRIPRIYMMMVSGGLVAPLAAAFLFVPSQLWQYVMYFFLYQVTNAFWSGVAYAYNAESFPTRYRGIATGWLDAAQIIGFLVGSAIWTLLIGKSAPLTWLIVAVGLSLGLYCTFFLRRIKPGQELEAIAQ